MSDVATPSGEAAPGGHPGGPDWFRRALADAPRPGFTEVEGARVAYSAWGAPERPGIVLIHGGGAHSGWWDHVAPWFSDSYRVVAVDLSGHGDSDHREVYTLETWTEEVMAAAASARVAGPPVVVGHSMGGFVAIAAGARFGEDLAGVIAVDSPVTEPDPEMSSSDLQRGGRTGRSYGSLDEIAARFRTVPPQDTYLDYVMAHVARRSARQTDTGWRWKYDAEIFTQFGTGMRAFSLPYLRAVKCRFALLAADRGLVTPDIGRFMYEALGRAAPLVWLPDSGHHPMLDQPLVLVSAIRALLADWQHSVPRRGPAERGVEPVPGMAATGSCCGGGPAAP